MCEKFLELHRKINLILKLNKELMEEVEMCNIAHHRNGFLLVGGGKFRDLCKAYDLRLEIVPSKSCDFDFEVRIPELQLFTMVTTEELIEIIS